jgi:hypothetical protein
MYGSLWFLAFGSILDAALEGVELNISAAFAA